MTYNAFDDPLVSPLVPSNWHFNLSNIVQDGSAFISFHTVGGSEDAASMFHIHISNDEHVSMVTLAL